MTVTARNEWPADAERDNVYEVTVEASDETGNTVRLEVTVVNLPDRDSLDQRD